MTRTTAPTVWTFVAVPAVVATLWTVHLVARESLPASPQRATI